MSCMSAILTGIFILPLLLCELGTDEALVGVASFDKATVDEDLAHCVVAVGADVGCLRPDFEGLVAGDACLQYGVGDVGKEGLDAFGDGCRFGCGEPLLRLVEAAHEALDDFGLLVDEGGGCGEGAVAEVAVLVAEGCGEVACTVLDELLCLRVGHVDVVGVAAAECCEGVLG